MSTRPSAIANSARTTSARTSTPRASFAALFAPASPRSTTAGTITAYATNAAACIHTLVPALRRRNRTSGRPAAAATAAITSAPGTSVARRAFTAFASERETPSLPMSSRATLARDGARARMATAASTESPAAAHTAGCTPLPQSRVVTSNQRIATASIAAPATAGIRGVRRVSSKTT